MKNLDFELKPYCPRCGSIKLKKLSDGTIICKNPKCMAIGKMDWEKNELTMKINFDKIKK